MNIAADSDLLGQMRATLGRVELAFSLVSDAIVWIDREGRVRWCNAAFDALINTPHIQVLDKRLVELLPLSKNDERLSSEFHPVTQILGVLPKLSGQYDFVATNPNLILEISAKRAVPEQADLCAVLVIHDVTESVRAEQATQRLNLELAAKNRELEAFCYSVSHDLRAPLRGIDGLSQALLEDYSDKLDAEGKHYLHRVRAGAQRMAQLIDDMLRLSRVTRTELRVARVNLSELAQVILQDLNQTQPERKVQTQVEPGLEAEGDTQLLRVLLDNLLNNAWKFTNKIEAARVEFGVRKDHPERPFFVRDNGVGFAMQYASKLFGAFQRLHAESEYPGTGIGLATVQRIVQRHGGRVWIESEPDQGTTVFFTLSSTRVGASP